MSDRSTSHQRRAFAERLARAPLLLDGAMGTLLYSRGVPQRASLDELVETRPDLIGAIHREYIEAGADVIETHTFGANRLRLAPFGLADGRRCSTAARPRSRARRVTSPAAATCSWPARSGRSKRRSTVPMPPQKPPMRAAFQEQIEGLLEGGVDVLLFETFSDLDELLLGIERGRALVGPARSSPR